jgi:cytochrome c biogenesis protein CcmG/thiol:disulfide interchange protein DsbE
VTTGDRVTDPAPGGRRTLVLVAIGIPVLLLSALLIWATIRSGGQAGGRFVNDELGEVRINPKPAPAFELAALDGSTLSLASYRGKVVMVDFWASWCPPCARETPVLASVYDRYQGAPVEFIGISIWDRGQDAIRFVDRYDVAYPIAIDHDGRVAIDYGVTGIPEKFFIDPDGRLVRRFVGPMDDTTLEATLDSMLGRTP